MRIWGNQEISADMERLISLIRNKEIVLWAGSGLSLYAGYPSGTEFCNIICNAAKTESDKEILLRHKAVLMNVAEEFEQLYSRSELIGLVSTHFDKVPNIDPHAHYLCTQIPQINAIITTNYDRLFEFVYGDNINTVVGTQYKTSDKKPITLYKIHGDSSDSSSVILTSKDYATFYEGLNSLVWSKLKVILAEHSVLFVGYSLEDKNIEDIFEKVLTQVDTSKSEFFIAVPRLAEHKLRHFNTICKTTHLPIDGESLLQAIETAIRENIVFDAIDKKVSIDQAQLIAYKHGVEPTWRLKPRGGNTKIEIENYIVNPFESFIFSGITLTGFQETAKQMDQFLEDCDCHEMILPPECLTQFENVNGIKIPKKTFIEGKTPDFVKIEKPEQVDEVVLAVDNHNICKKSITLHSFWGSKRKRTTIHLPTMNISLLFENSSVNITLSFVDNRSAKETLDDLVILDLWSKGNMLVFSKRLATDIVPVLQVPPVDDESMIEVLSNFVSKNTQIHTRIMRLEKYLQQDFLLPKDFSIADRNAIPKVLSIFEPVETEGTLDLSVAPDLSLYETFKAPSSGQLEVTEMGEETVCLFGDSYIIRERKFSILSPVIENADMVGKAILSGEKPTAKIISSTGKVIMRCKL